jgi:hypothetical protein
MAGCGVVSSGAVGFSKAGMARLRVVRCGSVGQVWYGEVRHGSFGCSKAGQARFGMVRIGEVRQRRWGGAGRRTV